MGETQYSLVYGFVTDYRFALTPYSEPIVKVIMKGGEN